MTRLTGGARGRFAPTPSGRIHLGNAMCALLVWLSARSKGGRVILRNEDLDYRHCPPDGAALIEGDLRWLGLDWDEGGALGGPHGPYDQRDRAGIYNEYYRVLEGKGLLYPCFCSRAQLHAAQAPHLSDGRVVYSGRCRALAPEERASRCARRRPAMRLCVPDETITFTDGVFGAISENLREDCGDFIVRRSDGVHAYQLAVVVDDALMGVTEVVRGRDLLDSTPRQIYLYRLLGFTPPAFFHIPLLLAPDGRRLSKRDSGEDLGALRARRRPEEVVGLLAWLCGLADRAEPVRARELVPHFSWEKIPRADIRLPQEASGGEGVRPLEQ